MLSDLRLTLRSLRKAPGFTFVAILTLALGLGVNTTMFSIVNTLLFRALPYEKPEELIAIKLTQTDEDESSMSMSMAEFSDFREAQTSYESVFAQQSGTFNIAGGDMAPERFTGSWMSGLGLQTLGAQPLMGHWWTAADGEPAAAPVAVISEGLWQTRFGARPDAIGQTLRVNGELATVIGVTRGKFDFPNECDVWTPLRYRRTDEKRDNRYLDVSGRLREGVTIEQAREEMRLMIGRWAQAYPEFYKNVGVRVVSMREDFVGAHVRQMLAVMSLCVTMVLLIACTNVANLLLVRGGTRAKEMSIRSALGAARGQVIRLLMLESFGLALGGALLGWPIAVGLLKAFAYAMANSGDNPPSWLVWEMDWRVLIYVIGAVGFTCVSAGLMPALRIANPNLAMFLNDASRGSTGHTAGRLTRMLVVAEIAMSCVLLVMSGLMIRSVIAAANFPLGYDPAGIVSSRIGLPEAQYAEESQQVAFYENLVRNVRARPEVVAAGLTSRLPTWDGTSPVVLERSPLAGGAVQPRAGVGNISVGWFEVMGVKPLEGRDIDERDTKDQDQAVVVNAKLAETFWPGESAVGKRFKLGETDDVIDTPWMTVVGVVPSIYQGDFEDPVGPEVYAAAAQQGGRYFSLFVRTQRADPALALSVVREEVAKLDPNLPIYWGQPLQVHLDQAMFFQKLFAWIFGIFGGVALVLASVGIYGVMAFSVNQRTQEIGVRMALGATPARVFQLVLGQGGMQLGIGLAIGLTLAFFSSTLLKSFLSDVDPRDPSTFGATFVVLVVAGAVACVVPIWRALRVSPMQALRCD